MSLLDFNEIRPFGNIILSGKALRTTRVGAIVKKLLWQYRCCELHRWTYSWEAISLPLDTSSPMTISRDIWYQGADGFRCRYKEYGNQAVRSN
jgi:hypothetical protein